MDVLPFKAPQPTTPLLDPIAEAHHRIANSLALLVSTVRMQAVTIKKKAEPFSNAEVRHLLDGIAARISTMGQLHRILSRTSCDGVVSLGPHLKEVTDALVAALASQEQQVRVTHCSGDCLVEMRQVQPMVLILCEIFINAMKYAHPSGVPLIMAVECASGADGRLVLSISDDGVGLPENFEPGKNHGIGLRIMHSLAAELGGELQMQSSQLGLTFRLSLPAAAMPGAKLA
jgi:two-component sensor histidine kinase